MRSTPDDDADRQLDVVAPVANVFMGLSREGIIRLTYGERLREDSDIVVHGALSFSLPSALALRELLDNMLEAKDATAGMTRQ